MEDKDIPDQAAAIPIDEILDFIAKSDVKPVGHLRLAIARAADAAPRILAILEDAAEGLWLAPEDRTLLFYGLHVLGAAREPRACPPLLQLLRLPDEDLEPLLGDALTITLPHIMAGVFDGDTGPLFSAIADRTLDPFVRMALFGSLAFLTWDGRIDAEETRRFLVRFDDDRLGDDDDGDGLVWDAWQNAIAILGWRDLTPRVEAAYADERIWSDISTLEDYLEDLARAEAEPRSYQRLVDAHLGYIDDIEEALSWASDSSDEFDPNEDLDYASSYAPALPVSNPYRHVGRNDPCPCGSGKKAKKCCLASA
jgi:hypothetical protein